MKKYAAFISIGSLLVIVFFFQNFTRARNGVLNRDERIEARALLIKIANWLQTPTEHIIETSEGRSTEVRRYGFSRKLMYVRSLENPDKTETYVSEALASKICNNLEFLIAIGKSKSVAFDAHVPVRRYANLLAENFQVQNGVFKGGFMLSEVERSLSTKTTSNCGMAMLKAWEYLESHKPVSQRSTNSPYIKSAKRAASFLNKMRRPHLIKGLEDFVYLDNNGSPMGERGFYLDGVDSKGSLRVAATL